MQTLIHRQDCALEETCCAPKLDLVQIHSNTYANTSADVITDLHAHIHQQASFNTRSEVFEPPARGFQVIGPNRDPMLIDTVQACLEVASTIRTTGLANYRAARIPLVSGLVVESWEHYLRD